MPRSDLTTQLVGEETFISTFTHTFSLKLLKRILPVNLVKKTIFTNTTATRKSNNNNT